MTLIQGTNDYPTGSLRNSFLVADDNGRLTSPPRWVREWGLPSEPWTFLVGRDGRIKARFEGPVSSRELTLAVRRLLG